MAMKLDEIQSLLQSDDEEIRRSTVHTLKDLPLSESLTLILEAMGDESWRVRKESVEAFVISAPDENAIEKLLELLRSEENAGLRNSAAEAVVRLKTSAVLPLIGMAKDPDADVRKFIVDLMGAIGDPAFVEPLLNLLQDSDVNVASAAAEHLGVLGDSQVIPEIVKVIVSNQAVLFRFSALRALSTLAKHSTVPEEILKLADQDILRKAVYDCLGSISDADSVPFLLKGLLSHQKGSRAAALKAMFKIFNGSDSLTKHKIIEELYSINGSDVISGLLNLFDGSDSYLTEALIWCSVATRDVRFVPILLESLADERFIESALRSLRSFGEEGIASVVAGYAEANENARCAICVLIGECGYSGYSDLVGNALKDDSARVRRTASSAAAKLGLISSIPELVALVDDTDSGVSSSAISALQAFATIARSNILNIARSFSESGVSRHRRYSALLYNSLGEDDRLLLLAKDEDPMVREAAVSAIGRLNLKSSSSILAMVLVDENPDVRIAAAEALGNIKDASALDALEHTLEDDDIWVRCAILKSISRIDLDRAVSIIKRVIGNAEGLFLITCLQMLEADSGSDTKLIIKSSLANPDPDIARQASISLERRASKPD